MAKKKVPGIANRPLYSRISFMYQAASFLAATAAAGADHGSSQTAPPVAGPNGHTEHTSHNTSPNTSAQDRGAARTQNMSRRLLADSRSVSHKSLIRISPGMKRTICKFCDTLLVEGQTCTSTVENKSKGGKKPWADILVIKCHTCHRAKRFPVDPQRPQRRPLRTAPEKQQHGTRRGPAQDTRPQPPENPRGSVNT